MKNNEHPRLGSGDSLRGNDLFFFVLLRLLLLLLLLSCTTTGFRRSCALQTTFLYFNHLETRYKKAGS
jgi:hypothetical protein